MSRQLKPQKATTVRCNRTGIEHAIYFDRNRLDFFAEPAEGVVVRADTVDQCKKDLRVKLDELVAFDWKPVIVIDGPELPEMRHTTYGHTRDDDFLCASVEFKFRRCERSPHPSGERGKYVDRLMKEDWPESWLDDRRDDTRQRWEDGKELLHVWPAPSDVVLPYSPELWEKLIRLREGILSAAAQLETLLRKGQDDPFAFLALLRGKETGLLLGPASPEEDVPLRSTRRK